MNVEDRPGVDGLVDAIPEELRVAGVAPPRDGEDAVEVPPCRPTALLEEQQVRLVGRRSGIERRAQGERRIREEVHDDAGFGRKRRRGLAGGDPPEPLVAERPDALRQLARLQEGEPNPSTSSGCSRPDARS